MGENAVARAGRKTLPGVIGHIAIAHQEGVFATAGADDRIGAGQHEARRVRGRQGIAREHAIDRGAETLAGAQQAQPLRRFRQHRRALRHVALVIQRDQRARLQAEIPAIAGIARGLGVADHQAAIGVQAGVQRIEIVPGRGGVAIGQRTSGIGPFRRDPDRLAALVDHHAAGDRIEDVLQGVHPLQADLQAVVIGEDELQRRPAVVLVSRRQVGQEGLGRQSGKAGGVHLAAAAADFQVELIDMAEGRLDRPRAHADVHLAVDQPEILATGVDADGVLPGRADHIRVIPVAQDVDIGQAGAAVEHRAPLESRGVDPVAVLAADDARRGDVVIGRARGRALGAQDLAGLGAQAVGNERHPAQAARRLLLGQPLRGVDAGQAVGHDHQFGRRTRARAAGDRILAAHEDDLVLGAVAAAGLDRAAGHQAADQHGIAREGGSVDQGRAQAAIEPGVAEPPLQHVVQHGRGRARGQGVAIRGILRDQLAVAQGEVPVAVFGQGIAQRTRLRHQHVRALVAGEDIVAQAAAQHIGAGAADQGQVARIAGAVQGDHRIGMIGAAGRRGAVDRAIVLQRHGAHAIEAHRVGGGGARRRIAQHRRDRVAGQRGVALDAGDVFGGAAAQAAVAIDDVVAAAAADAVRPAAVGHGDDVVAQAADDVVAIAAARADHIADIEHAGQAAGVIERGRLILVVQVDGDVVFIGGIIQRGLARHADENLDVEIAHQRRGAGKIAHAAIGGHARAHIDRHAALRLHAGGDIGAELGEVQGVAALASLLGQGESTDARADDVGVAAAAACDDVLRVADGDGGVAHHGDTVAALRRTLDRADRPHIAESGRRRRRHFFAIAVGRGPGEVHRHAGGIAAVVQQRLAALGGAHQVEGLVADLQALAAIGRLEHHIDRMLGPVVVGIDRGVADLVAVVVADDGGDIALDGREVQRVVAVLVVLVAHPDAIVLLHALAQFDGRGGRGGVVVEHEGVVAAIGHQRVIGGHPGQRGAAGLHAGGRRHQPIPARHRQGGGFDGAVAVVQHPIAAQGRAAHAMGSRGHIGAGDGRQAVDKGHAAAAGGHIAAVEQDIAILGHRIAPGAQLVLVGIELAFAQRGRAQRERAHAAMAHDLHRGQVLVLGQDLGDLVHAVIAAVQHDDLGIVAAQHLQLRAVARGRGQAAQALGLAAHQAVEPLDHLFGVLDGRVHEDDLAHRRALGLRGVALQRRQRRGRFMAGQPGLGVALARGIGLGVLIQRDLFAQHALLVESGALDQVGMRARRLRLLGLRTGLARMGRRHDGGLVAGRRRRRRNQFGRHQIASLQRLEQGPPPEQGLLHLA